MGVLGLLGAITAVKFYKLLNIIGTSIIGAFLFIRGIAIYAGGYPNEFQLHNELVAGNIDNVPWSFYVYVIFMIIFSALSIVWKVKRLKINFRNHAKDGYFEVGS